MVTEDEREIQIRRMTGEDITQVKAIDELLIGSERALSWQLGVDVEVAVYRPALSLVAELEGDVIGFVLGDIRGAEYGKDIRGWIDMVGVHPRYHHMGVGRKLVDAFCGICEQNKVNVEVIIREDDELLNRFFTSVGFRRGDLINFVREYV